MKYELLEAQAKLSRAIRRQQSTHSHHGFKMIALVIENEGIKASKLAEILDIRPASLTDAVDRMEKHGLLYRVPDENDLRSNLIYTTDKGKELVLNRKKDQADLDEIINSVLTPEEIETYCKISEKLVDHLKTLEPKETEHKHRHMRRLHREGSNE